MAQVHDSMMNPKIETLLSKVDSRFTLVTLGSLPGPPDQLLLRSVGRRTGLQRAPAGDLGRPQAAVDRLRGDRGRQDRGHPRRPGAGRFGDERRVGPAPPADDAGRPHHRPRRHRRHRGLQGHRGLPPPGRRRRPRRPRHDRGCHPVRRRGRPSRPWPPSPCRPPCGPSATPSRTRGSAKRPTWWSCARPRPDSSAPTQPASPTICSPPPCWPPGLPCSSARPCTPRCGSTPPCRRTWPPCAAGGARRRARRGPAGRRRRRAGRLADPGDIVAALDRCSAAGPATSTACGCWSRPADPRGDRPGAGHHQPLLGQAGLRPGRARPARGAKVTLVTTVDRPVPPGIEAVDGGQRGRHGGRRRARAATPT